MLSVIFVILTLALVMFLVFKKVNIVIASIIASIVLAVLDRQDIITAMTETFMTGTANYVKNFFLLFFVSALFGKIMESTGAAAAIARGLANLLGEKFAILGVLIAGMVLCYGGISALVIAFTMYPLTLAVFKRANLPRRLIPGAIAAGCFTFAAAALPGTPQTINVTPIPYLGTTVIAGASIGIICGVIGIALIFVYMYWETARAKTAGDGFAADAATLEALSRADEAGAGINPLLALVPILVVIILLVGLKVNVLVSMLTGSAICILLFYKNVKNISGLLADSVQSAMSAAITTGCIVGYGSVVSSSTGYATLSAALLSLDAPPLISYGLTTTILAGAAGSGTGGLAIALENLAPQYLEMGISAELLHRIGCMCAIGLDSLPHCGAVVVLLTLAGMTHKDSYKQIFVTTVLITCFVAAIGIALATVMY
ncbi:GntP family permease [Intestinimonas butyriciproducens]|uniref:GntP family permease n=1 Tax=Intestinimonas butyriciproducens TaxID=1297617 RepID=UPI00051C4955|nr:GntP family permease [Intestinimonas butyriciproducens]